MPQTMPLWLYCPLQPPLASCTQLLFTPKPLGLPNATMMFMTRSYVLSTKPFNDGNITSKVPVWLLMLLLITETFNTSLQPKSSRVDKLDGPSAFWPSTSLFTFGLASSVPSLMHWLDDGTSILKRGIVTMPLPIHRTIGPYLRPNSWCRPFELLPSSSQPYEDLLSWIQNDSIPTSIPIYETTQFPLSTLIPNQTEHGPKPQMVYFGIQDAYMSQTQAIFDYVCSNTRTIIPLQAIVAKQRHFMQSEGNTTGLDLKPLSNNIARCAPPVHTTNLCTTDHMTQQTCAQLTLWFNKPVCHQPYDAINLCATDPMDFSSNSRSPICHGIQSLWISSRNTLCLPVMTQSWLLLIDSPSRLYSSQPTIWSLLISWCSYLSFISFRGMVSRAMLLPTKVPNSSHTSSNLLVLLSTWSFTSPPVIILKVVWPAPTCRVRIQQCTKCNHWYYTLLCQ